MKKRPLIEIEINKNGRYTFSAEAKFIESRLRFLGNRLREIKDYLKDRKKK